MNDDSSTYEIPEYIQSRLQPQIEVGFPTKHEEAAILRFNVPFAEEEALAHVTEFLQKAHRVNLRFNSRDGVNILRFAHKLAAVREGTPGHYLRDAIEAVLGQEGMDFLDRGVPRGKPRPRSAESEEAEENDDQ
jgi:hypothetical protein